VRRDHSVQRNLVDTRLHQAGFEYLQVQRGLLIAASLVGLATGNLLAILQSCAPPEAVGIWTGAENFAGNLAGIAAPLAVGFLITSRGSYVPGFQLASIILLAGVLAYWFVVGELKTHSS